MTAHSERIPSAELLELEVQMGRLIDIMSDISVRVAHLEQEMIGVHGRMNAFDARLNRIERRLGSKTAPH